MNATTRDNGGMQPPLDVLIVGAGISGIGLAAHMAKQSPQCSFLMLDRRERAGGTWDLFRYPGIRSDSDMYTLGFEFAPWCDEVSIAPGETILNYLDRVIDSRGLRDKMRMGVHVTAANWDSKAALWTLTCEDAAGKAITYSALFLYLGAGYYDHDDPHDPKIPGIEKFSGKVIHPQFWPEDYDYAGKRVVIVGSGATAVTLVPAMAEKAGHVTMLQRTPTFYIVRPDKDGIANTLHKFLPASWVYAFTRKKNYVLQDWLFKRARNKPEETAAFLKDQVKQTLGPAWSEKDFTPPYKPWEQRLCFVPNGDMFEAIKAGKASVETAEIDQVLPEGVRLKDGRVLPADVIVTATGLKLAVVGKIAVRLDGKPVNFADHYYYRSAMFSNVPNLAALFGYLNAGWTLRVDLVSNWLCRLFNQMDAWGVDVVTPVLADDHDLIEDPVFDQFNSGYLQRAKAIIPKSATTAPWRLGMNYRADREEMNNAPIDDGVLKFERVGVKV